jgi:Ca-activated chloride channel family protein
MPPLNRRISLRPKAYYQQALVLDPANENARFNLELALRELEKQKKQEEEKKKQQQKQQQKKGSQKENKEGEKKPSQEEQQQEKGDQKKKSDTQNEPRSGNEPKTQQETEPEAQKPQQAPAAPMQKQKAEALLDNIKEDRARFLKYQVPEANGRKRSSGKDW